MLEPHDDDELLELHEDDELLELHEEDELLELHEEDELLELHDDADDDEVLEPHDDADDDEPQDELRPLESRTGSDGVQLDTGVGCHQPSPLVVPYEELFATSLW